MKRIICMVISVLALLLLTACFSKGNDKTVISNSSIESSGSIDNYSDITIQSPMTLSSNALFPIIGERQYLKLKMIKGKYYEDWSPGAYMGTIWEGNFIIELTDESGNVISQTDLSKIYKEPLIFNSSFQIQFEDYNNDGDIDFTLGQYVSSNGRDYKLFTLRKDGKIKELPVKDNAKLFISNNTGFYSTKLTKIDHITFATEYYDNSKGENIENVFKWDGKEFVKSDGSHDDIAIDHELMTLPLLPEVYALTFEPLQLDHLNEGNHNSDWVYIKSVPFGQINEVNITLDIYEETTDRNSHYHGVIELEGKNYIIHSVSTSILNDHITCHEVCVYQQFFAGQDRYEFIGAIELWSNGPGHYIFVINDMFDDALLTFSMWGNASFLDLDMDGQDEFVVEFPGLHLNPPDIAIIRVQNGILEMTGYVGQQLRTVEMNRDYAILKTDGKQPLIHISNIQMFGEQIYEDQSADYEYDDGVLKMVEDL